MKSSFDKEWERDDRFIRRWFLFVALFVIAVWCLIGWAVYELVNWITSK